MNANIKGEFHICISVFLNKSIFSQYEHKNNRVAIKIPPRPRSLLRTILKNGNKIFGFVTNMSFTDQTLFPEKFTRSDICLDYLTLLGYL